MKSLMLNPNEMEQKAVMEGPSGTHACDKNYPGNSSKPVFQISAHIRALMTNNGRF
jgi:hypothetical protein